MSFKPALVASFVTIVLLDLALLSSGRKVLVQSKGSDGWVAEGDLLYPKWDPALNKVRDKKRVSFITCTYWTGLSLMRVSLPAADLLDGCPNGLFLPKR